MAQNSWAGVVGGLILLITAFLFYHTFDPSYQTTIMAAGRGPVFFPRIVLAAMLVFSLIVIVESRRQIPTAPSPKTAFIVLAVIAVTGAYIYAITVAGFLIPSIVFNAALPWLLGYRKWRISLLIAAIYPFAVWYIFEKIFLIILPSSPWFEMF